jgi:archaellum component FlaG (FlaF/FlaG flagellin family)
MMNRKGVEGLPLKYIIVAIIAALVVGVLINVTSTIGISVQDAAGMFVAKLQNLTNSSLG